MSAKAKSIAQGHFDFTFLGFIESQVDFEVICSQFIEIAKLVGKETEARNIVKQENENLKQIFTPNTTSMMKRVREEHVNRSKGSRQDPGTFSTTRKDKNQVNKHRTYIW